MQKKYAPIQQELMAIVYKVQAFKRILYGTLFIISGKQSLSKMITCWLLQLSEYAHTFQHIPGKFNILAYFTSRIFADKQTSELNLQPNLLSSSENLSVIISDNDSHDYVNNIKNSQNNSLPTDPVLQISQISLLYYQYKNPDTQKIIND